MLRFMFCWTHTLDGEQRVLRTAIPLFTNSTLLAPQVAINGVPLRHFVVAKALLEVHAAAVAELAQQAEHLPLDVGGGLFGRVAEIDFVLDLEPAQLRLKVSQFLVDSHQGFSQQQCRARAQSRRGTRRSREGWN